MDVQTEDSFDAMGLIEEYLYSLGASKVAIDSAIEAIKDKQIHKLYTIFYHIGYNLGENIEREDRIKKGTELANTSARIYRCLNG